ncbi:MAG: hypothetical protein IJ326_02720 [Lachnospiraceae bacterium]|nr:hypothetical protein [Lachnospiraceae bacterium]
MRKENVIQFLTWFRNGVAFVTVWLLLLAMIRNQVYGIETIETEWLWKLLISVAGGVLLFCVAFTSLVIRHWGFQMRLTAFMLAISVYECVCFYWMGIFGAEGTLIQYAVFAGIVLVCYFICTWIYSRYSRAQGELYTKALQDYQERSV